MSKHPKRLWQRLKMLFKSEQSAGHESTVPVETINTAEIVDMPKVEALSSDHHINAAFDEDSQVEAFTESASTAYESFDTPMDEDGLPAIRPDEIEQLLTQMGYQFLYHPADENDEQSIHHYTMQVSDKERRWGCMIRFFSEQQLIAVYSIYPASIAEANRPEMLAMLSYLNYDLIIGNLEMDVMDGELRFKTSLDLEVTGVNEMVMSYLLQSNFSLFSRLYDTISDMIAQPHPTHDLQDAVDKLVQSQQSRNFFLASDAIQ